MLSQPPTSGKSALGQLEDQVRGDYFPTDKAGALTQLEAGYLHKPRTALVRNFAIVLLKIVTDPGEKPKARARAAAALNALREMHPGESNTVLKDKLTDRLRPHTMKDENLRIAVVAMAQIEDSEAYIASDVRDRLLNFIATTPDDQLAKTVPGAMRVSFMRNIAIARTASLGGNNLRDAVTAATDLIHEKQIRLRAIELYTASGSFNEANGIALSVIMPMTQAFEREEIEAIVHSGAGNGQVLYSHEFPVVLAALKENKNVDASWWDPLLKVQNEDDRLDNLYFHPPAEEAEEAAPPNTDEIV